ncbi:GAF domain-containing protein [Persicobacter sp. CCB-QB2]|uniref:GAF domain-containing protein n=1 Tax=Persicobacter sp. CCB-QB2 TaxID=1561025 RepID=UPI0006A9F60B|nr:GAF domain-containing protein [Persicobacter sp. CCB-QB2]
MYWTTLFNLLSFCAFLSLDGWKAPDLTIPPIILNFVIPSLIVIALIQIILFSMAFARGYSLLETESIELLDDLRKNECHLEKRAEELELAMRKAEKAQKLNQEHQWVIEGTSKIEKLLRSDLDVENLIDQLIQNLVKYLNANQAALFFTTQSDEGETLLEMKGCYAYDRKKYLHKKINIGEGLTGQCYLEAEEIFLTDIPTDYPNITSGLGDAPPRCLSIIPLKYSDTVEGILEIASFQPFGEKERNFLKQISNIIANHYKNLMNNEQMKALAQEAQKQAELLRQQEEELRQNLEEIESIREFQEASSHN